MRITRRVTACAAVAVLSACSRQAGVDELAAVDRPNDEARLAGARLERAHTHVVPAPAHISLDERQLYLYGALLDGSNPRKFLLRNEFEDPSTGEWEVYDTEFNTSFDVLDACSRAKGRFYLMGLNQRNGVDTHVLEEWTTIPQDVPYGQHPVSWEMQRDQLYRHVTLGEVRRIQADPEGRFLLILHAAPGGIASISRMDLPSAAVTTLYTESQIPHLTVVERITRLHHVSEGRMWMLEDGPMDDITVLRDVDNDGFFDSHATMDYATWVASGYLGQVWANDFVTTYP